MRVNGLVCHLEPLCELQHLGGVGKPLVEEFRSHCSKQDSLQGIQKRPGVADASGHLSWRACSATWDKVSMALLASPALIWASPRATRSMQRRPASPGARCSKTCRAIS